MRLPESLTWPWRLRRRLPGRLKIRLLKRYPQDRFTFKVLNDDYGIFAVRGPRGIPKSLSEDLNR